MEEQAGSTGSRGRRGWLALQAALRHGLDAVGGDEGLELQWRGQQRRRAVRRRLREEEEGEQGGVGQAQDPCLRFCSQAQRQRRLRLAAAGRRTLKPVRSGTTYCGILCSRSV